MADMKFIPPVFLRFQCQANEGYILSIDFWEVACIEIDVRRIVEVFEFHTDSCPIINGNKPSDDANLSCDSIRIGRTRFPQLSMNQIHKSQTSALIYRNLGHHYLQLLSYRFQIFCELAYFLEAMIMWFYSSQEY
jgi:hypothetical protein